MKIFENKFFGHTWIESRDPWGTPGKIEKMYHSFAGEDLALFRRVCAGLPCPKQLMIEYGDLFGWNEEMIAEARIFTPRPLPSPVHYFQKTRDCYENCYHKSRAEGILYVEGLMICPAGPIIHAWNSTDGHNVIDLGEPCQHLNRYFGMVFDTRLPLDHPDCRVGSLGWAQHYALKKFAPEKQEEQTL